MKLTNQVKTIQKQVMTQNQIITVNFIAMTNVEMQAYIQAEYDVNPLIEHHQNLKESPGNLRADYSVGTSSRQDEQSDDYEMSNQAQERMIQEEQMVKLNILMQLNRKEFSEVEWTIMSTMIDFLDDHGYLKTELVEIAKVIQQPLNMVENAHRVLSKLNPMGIFSKSVTEYILKQLLAKEEVDPNLIKLMTEYTDEITKGNRSKIAKELKITSEELSHLFLELSKLRVNPIERSDTAPPEYIVPDIIINRIGESYEVVLNDGWMGEYQFSDYYLNLMNTTADPTLKEYLNIKHQKSKFLFECIEMRRETIIKIMTEIVEIQKDFFFESQELKPMILEDIALKINMHISTVSRALRGKYIEYPNGSILGKDLFVQGIKSSTGEDTSKIEIEKNLLQIIQEEDKSAPLSDGQIEKKLKEKGISISRRTISKYRNQLGILDSYNRKYAK